MSTTNGAAVMWKKFSFFPFSGWRYGYISGRLMVVVQWYLVVVLMNYFNSKMSEKCEKCSQRWSRFYFFYRKVYFLKNNIIRNSQFLISLGQSLNIELFLLTDPRCFQYNGPDAECCTEDLLLKRLFHYITTSATFTIIEIIKTHTILCNMLLKSQGYGSSMMKKSLIYPYRRADVNPYFRKGSKMDQVSCPDVVVMWSSV